MFITKKRHESEMAEKDLDIEYHKNMEFLASQSAKEFESMFKKAIADLAESQEVIADQEDQIERLRPLAEKYEAKLARDRKRVRGGAKVAAKSAMKKGVGK